MVVQGAKSHHSRGQDMGILNVLELDGINEIKFYLPFIYELTYTANRSDCNIPMKVEHFITKNKTSLLDWPFSSFVNFTRAFELS